jgi:hypothetical protein
MLTTLVGHAAAETLSAFGTGRPGVSACQCLSEAWSNVGPLFPVTVTGNKGPTFETY